MSKRLDDAVRSAIGRTPAKPKPATAEEHLEHLEQELQEVRTRVNGLFFAVLAANLVDVVARMFLP